MWKVDRSKRGNKSRQSSENFSVSESRLNLTHSIAHSMTMKGEGERREDEMDVLKHL